MATRESMVGGNPIVLREADYSPPNVGAQSGCNPLTSIVLAGTSFDTCSQDQTFYDYSPQYVPIDPCVSDGPDSYNQLRKNVLMYDTVRKREGQAVADRKRAQDCGESFEWIWLALALSAGALYMWVA